MSNPHVTYYTARGILLSSPQRMAKVQNFALENVQQLMDRFEEQVKTGVPDPEIINDIIELASPLFAKGAFLVCDQMPTAEKMHEFLEDTQRFISGQPRKLSVRIWDNFIGYVTEEDTKAAIRNPLCRTKPYRFTEKDIVAWMRQDNGIYDMLCVMHILFNNPE